MDEIDVFDKSWYLIYSKPNQELSAKMNLERQGYEVYLPMIHAKKKSSTNSTRLKAMFPRYLFIRLTKNVDNWSSIRSTIGVSHIVKFGLELAKVPLGLVNTLQKNADDDGNFEMRQTQFKPGDRIRIAEGCMEGYEGIMLARTSKERLMLLLNSLDSSIRKFEISDDQLELIS